MSASTGESSTETAGKRLALVIGVNQTQSSLLPPLQHAIADAEAIAEVLQHACDFELFLPPLLGEQATSAAVKKAVLNLARNKSDDDLLFLYFSGHGQQAYDPQRSELRHAYLGTADFNDDDVTDDPTLHITMHWLRDKLFKNTTAGQVLIILDCCYAEDVRTVSDHTLDELREQIAYYLEIPGAEVNLRRSGLRVALAACGYDQVAGEQDGNGLLTRHLLQVLRGEVPALVNNDGNLTLSSTLEYILTTMPALQKPVISLNNSTGKECMLARHPEVIAQRRRQQAQVRRAERPTNYLPFPRDPLFQPRPGEFERLEALLAASDASQPVHAGLVGVTGLGGVGKTQLAVEFAYRYQQRFPDGIFWMPANGTTQADWQHRLAELAFHSDYLPPDDDRASPENEARRARHLCRYLASHANALLILDNVERPDLLLSALPALAGGHFACSILYTSRNTQTPPGVVAHPVEQLLEEPSLRLLLTTARPVLLSETLAGSQSPEACAALTVCAEVGYLPLACVHLRSLLEQDRQVLLTRLAEVLRQEGTLDAVTATFRLSWQRVQTEEARRLFLLACTFPEANPIPRWLLGLTADLGEQDDIFTPLGKARLHLRDLSLLEDLSNDQVLLHPLVRAFGLHVLKEGEAEGSRLREEAAQRLASVCADLHWLEQRAREKGYWICLEQVRAMLEAVERLDANECAERIRQIERWLDRESYLLAAEQWWPEQIPGLFYQQLYNHALEAGQPFPLSQAPACWLKQTAGGVEEHHRLRIFAGHTGSVYSVAFSPDGKQVLTGAADGTAQLWDASSGRKLLHMLVLDGGNVNSVAFSPDGKQMLTGSNDGTAQLWDASSGRELLRLEGHTNVVFSVAFSPDGKQVLTGSGDGTARLWDSGTGRELLRLEGHTSSVYSVAFSPDGTQILTGSEDRTARLWEVRGKRELLRLEGHAGWVFSVAFSPDGKQILTGSSDKTARLWETSSGRELLRLEGHTSLVYSVAFSPDGKHILTGSFDQTARLWDTSSRRELLRLEGHTNVVFSVAFSPDGKHILTGSSDNTARLWDADTGRELLRLEGHTDWVGSVAFSPDGKHVLTGSGDETARLWDTSSGRELLRLEGHRGPVNSVAFSPDGKHILTGSHYQPARLWDASNGRELLQLEAYTGPVLSVAFSPDGKRVLTVSSNKTTQLWETSSGHELLRLEGHTDLVYSVAFSPDGTQVLSGSRDKTARLWDTSSGQQLLRLEGHTGLVNSVAFSPDGRLIVSCDEHGHVYFWSLQDAGRLLGIYVARDVVGALYWQDATHLILADRGGSSRYPRLYHLELVGM